MRTRNIFSITRVRKWRKGDVVKRRSFALYALIIALICLVAVVFTACVKGGVAVSEYASEIRYNTVAVHDPSIVLAYEDGDGKTYPEQNEDESLTKVYYVFGTQIANAKSYDLVNWKNFSNNMNDAATLYELIKEPAQYADLTVDTVIGNCWAPDVIYNPELGKWCMYLSVNGNNYNSSVALLTADSLDGDWTYVDTVVWSGFNVGGKVQYTDFEKVTGTSTVDYRYKVYDGSATYMINAIDPCVFFDEDGGLWMTYGSWFGGVYMLKLDKETGLRDYDVKYETKVDGVVESESNAFTVYSDEYFGKHIAGGAGCSGEGSYIEYIDGYYYLFISYGGYGPQDGYNMRYFRSETPDGDYVDANGDTALYIHTEDRTFGSYDKNGIRVMSGYTWAWWDFDYVAQGHNSVFVDDDGKAYVVYHNKFTDGTIFHVMKAHELLTVDGWLVAAPFEAIKESDKIATGLSLSEIAGDYGAFVMTCDNGTYKKPCEEEKTVFEADGTVSGAANGNWTYDAATGSMTVTVGEKTYKGFVLEQTLEGTSIKTLSVAALSAKDGETLWTYKYPSEGLAISFAQSGTAIPHAANIDMLKNKLTFTDDVWYGNTITLEKSEDGYVGADGSGNTVLASDYYAEYFSLRYGQSFVAMPALEGGFSITFDYGDYNDDWVPVFEGDNVRLYLAVLQYDTSNAAVSIFENMASAGDWAEFADAPYKAFYTNGNAKATISVNDDKSIDFYRDGVLVLSYAADTQFIGSSRTVADLADALVAELKAGTLACVYDTNSAVIAAPIKDGNIPYVEYPENPIPDNSGIVKLIVGCVTAAIVLIIAVVTVAILRARKKKEKAQV